ncbi:hypothetical protein GCM10010234_17620 [Streptomyces hawaiiensis]
MPHANAALSVGGRRRLVKRCQERPIAHVAAEVGISRVGASNWVNRWRLHGDAGSQDRTSSPHRIPNATPAWAIEQIKSWHRNRKPGKATVRWPGHMVHLEVKKVGRIGTSPPRSIRSSDTRSFAEPPGACYIRALRRMTTTRMVRATASSTQAPTQ